MEFTEIKAPIAGRISRKLVSEGNLVNANQTVLTNIVSLDPDPLLFRRRRALVSSPIRGRRSGGTQTIGRDGAPTRSQLTMTDESASPAGNGRLDFIDNRLDAASGTMRARAIFDNKDLFLTPGLFGRITLSGSDPYKGVLVPDEAIGSDQDRRVVYVVGADNTVSHRKPCGPAQASTAIASSARG